MSEFALSSPEENPNRKKNSFSSLLLSDFHLFCSFIFSHPFYFSYLLFFSPYIFKILSFLSPLFITTTLLLLALLSTLHVHDTCPDSESPETQQSFLFSFCSKLGSALEPKFELNDEYFKSLEDLEAYKLVVEGCSMECASENESMEICSDDLKFVDKFCSHESTVSSEALKDETSEEPVVEIQLLKFEDPMDLKKEETEKCEREDEKVKPKSDLFLDNGEGQYWKRPTKQESKALKVDLVGDCNDESYDLPKFIDFLGKEKKDEKQEEEEDVALGSFGSMNKEKEWRRTLACKLFEERHNADVGQGMDQLWETYETETEKTDRRRREEEEEEGEGEEEEQDDDEEDEEHREGSSS